MIERGGHSVAVPWVAPALSSTTIRTGPRSVRSSGGCYRSVPYASARGSRELARHLAFRNWLRAHSEVAAADAALKRSLATQYPNDVDAYCDAKSEFVEGILEMAMGWRIALRRTLMWISFAPVGRDIMSA